MTHPHLLSAMSEPEFYPNRPDHVEVVQTHISFIFIAGDVVYKVKKAVNFGFLDFTTLEQRRYYCEEELRLNRRLAPEIYLDVVEIVEREDGTLALGTSAARRGNGPADSASTFPIVDYAVVMRRLPEERMLKRLLPADKVPLATMERIAERVARFHAEADTGGAIDEVGSLETVWHNHEENFEQTAEYVGITIPERQYAFISASARAFLETRAALLRRRVAEHRIRDCHGDLHIEHICLLDDSIVIFDCIEFNERFRFEDVAAEVAFLAMDLDFNGYAPYADAFVDAYVAHSGDTEIRLLLNFYESYYAYVRGKVVGFRIHDTAIAEADRNAARDLAARYFDLAYAYASRLDRPTLILTCGLMGTGKSVLAGALASRLGAEWLQMDVLRKELLDIPADEHHFEPFGQGIYSADVTRRTYAGALARAEALLLAGRSVIIDASYRSREDRLEARSVAERLEADFRVVECQCPEDVLRERLDARLGESGQASDGRWEIYTAQKASFEAATELPASERIVVNTAETSEACVDAVLRWLRGIG